MWAFLAVLMLAATPAMAGPGAILVESGDTCASLADVQEENVLAGGTVNYIWVNHNTLNLDIEDYVDWELFNNKEMIDVGIAYYKCNILDYTLYEFDLIAVAAKKNTKPETLTLIAFDRFGNQIGKDTFRID